MPWKHISIARLEIANFKRFYGHHVLDLLSQPDANKPLILIGGENGSGKTSIHEAIYYALYVDNDLPGIQTRPNYLRAVSDRLNRRALDDGRTDYGVAVEMMIRENGGSRQIRIERRWDANIGQRSVQGFTLELYEGGRRIDWIDESPVAYQDFLRSLLPPQIAPFFFFDGERIQHFADDVDQEKRMIEAVEDILHISVYKLLRDDLKKHVIDEIQRHEKAQQQDDFFELQGDKERIEKELEDKKDRLSDIRRDIEDLRREQKRIEDELRRIAGPHDSQREELIEERARLEGEMEETKQQIQTGFEPLPILLAGHLRDRLRQSLEEEQRTGASPQRLEELRKQVSPFSAASIFFESFFFSTQAQSIDLTGDFSGRGRVV
jgi:DNA sulfur modification protein DndD